MKVKVSELSGAALDWAVAKCEGYVIDQNESPEFTIELFGSPSTNWDQGGSIIERINGFQFKHWMESNQESQCQAEIHNYDGDWIAFGHTMLIAAMRCFVKSKLGESVEIPDQLC